MMADNLRSPAAMEPDRPLVPHQPPLLLLDAILDASESSCTARVTVDPDAWYAEPGGAMPAWFGLELMAQTAAAFNGRRARGQGRPPALGYLIGTREYVSTLPRFPAGATLEVAARELYPATFGQSAMTCEIRHQGSVVASATLKFFEPT